ncbi:hypothetical protein ECDEC13D_2096 [Escherichia coli DEC13D]|nr:hypothetical protein ECDEC13D_2096 [Escherichia coli DEC13D]EHX74327.1 hypothetical protein ECDEC13E_2134 [Escherichia coli DEC13E]
MLGGADNPNGELLSYIIGADNAKLKKFMTMDSKLFTALISI